MSSAMSSRMAGVGQASLGINTNMRLPRARSIPNSRQWAMQNENSATGEQSFSSTAPSNRIQTRSTRAHTGGRSGSQPGFGQKAYNIGRQHASNDTGQTVHMHDQRVNMWPTRQVPGQNSLKRNVVDVDIGMSNVNNRVTPQKDVSKRNVVDVDLGMPNGNHRVTSQKDVSRRPLSESMRCGQEVVSGNGEACDIGAGGDYFEMPDPSGVDGVAKVVSRSLEAGPNRLTKKLSLQSDDAMRRLSQLDIELKRIEQKVAQIDQTTRGSGLSSESASQMKTALAQLEADAHKLEAQGVDSIYTSSLVSGLTCAKELKKAQLQRLEVLFNLIEDVFRCLKQPTRD